MKKPLREYRVYVSMHTTIVVEARNEERAEEIALDEIYSEYPGDVDAEITEVVYA